MQKSILTAPQPAAITAIFAPVTAVSSGITVTWKTSGWMPIPAANLAAIIDAITQGKSAA